MSFETVSLLLNWLQMGALLAILFRLSYTFQLIASTQRELRRAIHHLGERHMRRDFDEIAEDIKVSATKVRHPERLRQAF
jgi:hypothetical protein